MKARITFSAAVLVACTHCLWATPIVELVENEITASAIADDPTLGGARSFDLLVTSEISEEDYLTLKGKHGTPEWQKTIDDMLVDGKITTGMYSELNKN